MSVSVLRDRPAEIDAQDLRVTDPDIGAAVVDRQRGNGEQTQEQAALVRCQQQPGAIRLMVTDVVMPGVSGPQLARQMAPLAPDMKVLYLSGYTDDAIVHHGMLDPDTPFLQKPFGPDALARKVREVLDR